MAVPSGVTETTALGVFRRTAAVARDWIDAGEPVAVGVLVAVEGSAPLDPGSAMFVRGDGVVEGSVTGGCVESAIAGEALDLLETDDGPGARMLTFGISDELAGTVGLTCGGTVHVLVQRLEGDAREATRAGLDAVAGDRPVAIVRVLDGRGAGTTMTVDDEHRIGTLGVALLDDNAEREARALLAQGVTLVRRFGADGATMGDDIRVFVAAHAQAADDGHRRRRGLRGRARADGAAPRLPGEHQRPALGVRQRAAAGRGRRRGDRVAPGGARRRGARPPATPWSC